VRRHGADTGHVAQSPTVAGMGSPLGVGATGPGRESQAHDGAAPRCQSIKCPYPRAGTGVRVRRSLERGEARSRGLRTLERGGARSREACTLERGGACSRGPLTGPPRWAAGATAAWASSRAHALSEMRLALVFLQVLSGISPVVLGDRQGCPRQLRQ
jgi:hypothetical protein